MMVANVSFVSMIVDQRPVRERLLSVQLGSPRDYGECRIRVVFLPLDLTMSTSMMYELIEWGAAKLLGGDLGMAYLGTQGDIWDAHMDMALASLGALIAMMVTALINIKLQRDFAREWNESLRIKGQLPLGEDRIKRYLDEASKN